MNTLPGALRTLNEHAGQLTAGERPLVDFLARLPEELWDEDCATTGAYLAAHHRDLLASHSALPEPDADPETVAAAAERVQANRRAWEKRRHFADQCVARLEAEGTTTVIVVSMPFYQPRLVHELQLIPGYRYLKTFRQYTKVSLFPPQSALEVVRLCQRHGITPDGKLLALVGPVGELAGDDGREPDISYTPTGKLCIRFPFDRAAVTQIKAIPGRTYDRATPDAWYVPADQLGAVIAFAQQWGLVFHPDLRGRVRAVAAAQSWNERQSVALAPECPVADLAAGMGPAQAAAVEFTLRNRRLILAAVPGSPRAAEALEAVRLRPRTAAGRVLIACAGASTTSYFDALASVPAAAVDPWRQQDGTVYKTVSFDELKADPAQLEALAEWAPTDLVVDETRERLAQAKVTPALVRLGELVVSRGGIALVIANSPVLARPKEVLAFLRITGRLGVVAGDEIGFMDRFCGRREGAFGISYTGASDLAALDEMLRRAGAYMRQSATA